MESGVRQVPEGSGEQGTNGGNGCKIICGAPAMMMAHSAQTRLVGKVDGQFLHAHWWL